MTVQQDLANHYNIQLTPNPFTTNSFLKIDLEDQANVQIDLLNIHGQKIKEIIPNQPRQEGEHTIELKGKELSNGIYFARLIINEQVFSLKMVKF